MARKPGSPPIRALPAVDHDMIRDLAKLLDETGLTEIEFERDGVSMRVARHAALHGRARLSEAAPAHARGGGIRRVRRDGSIPASSLRRWSAPPIAGRRPARGRSSRSAAR